MSVTDCQVLVDLVDVVVGDASERVDEPGLRIAVAQWQLWARSRLRVMSDENADLPDLPVMLPVADIS